jgi:hypothetical protein
MTPREKRDMPYIIGIVVAVLVIIGVVLLVSS